MEVYKDERYDVVIFDKATRKIVAVPGENLKLVVANLTGAADVYETQRIKIDRKNYDLDIVKAGLFKKGDTYK